MFEPAVVDPLHFVENDAVKLLDPGIESGKRILRPYGLVLIDGEGLQAIFENYI